MLFWQNPSVLPVLQDSSNSRPGRISYQIPRLEIGRAAFNVTLDALLRIQEYISEAASLMP